MKPGQQPYLKLSVELGLQVARTLLSTYHSRIRTTCFVQRESIGLLLRLRLWLGTRIARARAFSSRSRTDIVFKQDLRRWSAISSRSRTEFALCTWKPDGPGRRVMVSCAVAASRRQTSVTWESKPLTKNCF